MWRYGRWLLVPLLAVTLAACGSTAKNATTKHTLTVFAAASLTGVFTDLGHRFEAAHAGTKVVFSFGASSTLAEQITQGAPADVFAAADTRTMGAVTAAKMATGTPTIFARNQLVIGVPAGNPKHITSLADLTRPGLKVALCAPQVPCGAAAAKALTAAGVKLEPATYQADVKSTLTQLLLGEVDAVLVYRTDVKAAGAKVEGVAFPQSAGAINNYPIAVLTASSQRQLAQQFVDLVLSATGRQALAAAGFQSP